MAGNIYMGSKQCWSEEDSILRFRWFYYRYMLYIESTSLNCITVPLPRSDQPRRAAVVNYFADGVQSNSDDSLLNGIPAIAKVHY